ncbi:hypothetical protein [Mycobacterium sp. NPDC050853]|uniref:hypothetical protein n=1 Tax=Mycobacterium sp. NPDC050853 TaxID=3155160 RepID=UPI0033F945CD
MELDPEGNYSKISGVVLKPGLNALVVKKGSFKVESGVATCEVTIIASDVESIHMSLKDRLS